MSTIFKYPLEQHYLTGEYEDWEYEAYMPMVARVLKCGFQNGKPFVWALFDDGVTQKDIPFLILPTGHSVNYTARHLETVFNGDLIWHFFVVEGSHGVSAHP